MPLEIAILETGGTINGILSPDDSPPAGSRVVRYLEEQADDGLIYSAEIVVMKDSRALDGQDRDDLARAIEATACGRVLIPHGTFTMTETGEYLRSRLRDTLDERCVVLVGAAIPLGEPGSDAPANLSFAIDCLRQGLVGIWVAMAGQLWDPREVVKDPQTGEFVKRVSTG